MNVEPTTLRERGGLRIGDAEREQAAQSLGEHLRAGRLDVGEYDERLTAAFAARTADDLTPLFIDLPGGSPVAPPRPEPQPRTAGGGGPRTRRRGFGAVAFPLRFVLVLALIAGAIIWTALVAFPPLFLIPLLWFGFGRRFGHRRRGYAGHGPRRYHY